MGESKMKFRRIVVAFVGVSVLAVGTTFAGRCSVSDETPESTDDGCVQKDDLKCEDRGDCDGEKSGCCSDSCCPFELFPETCRGVKVGGWFQTGYHTEGANGNGTQNPITGFGFNNYPNVAQLHQAWIYAEKVAENCGYGFDWGFRADYVYGTDGQDTQAFGNVAGIWDEPWDNGANYGSAVPQFYGEVAYNDLKVKVGHFYTIIGYEVVPAVDNFFYSHSFTIGLEPFTHTGFLAEYALGDRVTLYGGWTAGLDTGFDQNGGDTLLGGCSLQLSDDVNLTYAMTMGDFGFAVPGPVPAPGSDSNGYAHSIVLDWDLTSRLKYVLQTDYVDNALLTFGTGPISTINQYAMYTLNDQWALGARLEQVNFAGVVPVIGPNGAGMTEVTVGANYRPNPNFVIRPEARVDIFDVGGVKDSTVFGIDAIMTF